MKRDPDSELSVWSLTDGYARADMGRFSLGQGEGAGEGCSQRVVRIQRLNPSPCSAPLAQVESRNKYRGIDDERIRA